MRRKVLYLLLICTILFSGILSADNIVNFECPEFEYYVREGFAKEGIEIEDEITVDDMKLLTEIIVGNKQVESIKGIEYAENITYLKLCPLSLRDYKPLYSLTNLEAVHIRPARFTWELGYKFTDLDVLRNNTNIKYLDINSNGISDISALEHMPHLAYLHASGNFISDLSVLSNRTVSGLLFSNNPISDLSPLESVGFEEVVLNQPGFLLSGLYLFRTFIDHDDPETMEIIERLQNEGVYVSYLPNEESDGYYCPPSYHYLDMKWDSARSVFEDTFFITDTVAPHRDPQITINVTADEKVNGKLYALKYYWHDLPEDDELHYERQYFLTHDVVDKPYKARITVIGDEEHTMEKYARLMRFDEDTNSWQLLPNQTVELGFNAENDWRPFVSADLEPYGGQKIGLFTVPEVWRTDIRKVEMVPFEGSVPVDIQVTSSHITINVPENYTPYMDYEIEIEAMHSENIEVFGSDGHNYKNRRIFSLEELDGATIRSELEDYLLPDYKGKRDRTWNVVVNYHNDLPDNNDDTEEDIEEDNNSEGFIPFCDLNGDGKTMVNDAIIALRSVVGLTELTENQRQIADVDGDGKITVADVILILRHIVGL